MAWFHHVYNELTSDVHLWTPSHGWTKAGRPARTYIQHLCANTGCSIEYLPEEMDERDGWRKRVLEIDAIRATWWWWWWMNEPETNRKTFLKLYSAVVWIKSRRFYKRRSLLTNELEVQIFLPESDIAFLSQATLLGCNIKWEWECFSSNSKSNNLENISTANARRPLVYMLSFLYTTQMTV